jgi:NDP-sugar pyrophosphorylase family protein
VSGAPTHALVLTAGLGTRLRPLTEVRAKPAIPVAGHPLARRIVRWLATQGVTDIVMNLHYLPATLTAVVGDGSDLGARVRYSWEQPSILGSAGGPRLALDIVGAAEFFLVNGDTLTDLDVAALAGAHRASGARVTMAVTPNVDPDRYGGIVLDSNGAVTGFARRGPGAAGSYHFIGVQLVSADVFRPIPKGEAAGTVGGLYDRLAIEQPGSVRGFVANARFWDIGTVADYWETSRDFARAERAGGAVAGARAQIDPSARIADSILWDDVQIGANVRLERCIVTDGVELSGAQAFANSIILQSGGRISVTPW